MKKVIYLLLALCLMAPVATVEAQNSKALEKALKKEFKEKKKELKKGKWQIFGSSRSLDVVLAIRPFTLLPAC